MSWSGTVTCSHCYNRGHNRRKCPELTTKLKRDWAQQIAYRDEYASGARAPGLSDEERERNVAYHAKQADSYREKYLKRTKIDLATGTKVTNKAAKAERMKKVTCGYCGQRGHTRRVCQNVKNDYAVYAARTKQVRQEWYEKFKASGMGLGSMVVARMRGYNKDGDYGPIVLSGLVTGVSFGYVCAHSPDPNVIEVKTNDEMRGIKSNYQGGIRNLKLGDADASERSADDRYTLLPSGRVPEAPADWLDNVKAIKEVFCTKEDRPWDYKWKSEGWIPQLREELGIPQDAYGNNDS